jgi:hypothetical protein
MSDISETIEELPKKKLAKRVITDKKLYFFPAEGTSIEARSHEEAVAKIEKQVKAKDGDA